MRGRFLDYQTLLVFLFWISLEEARVLAGLEKTEQVSAASPAVGSEVRLDPACRASAGYFAPPDPLTAEFASHTAAFQVVLIPLLLAAKGYANPSKAELRSAICCCGLFRLRQNCIF